MKLSRRGFLKGSAAVAAVAVAVPVLPKLKPKIETHTLHEWEMPSHTHSVTDPVGTIRIFATGEWEVIKCEFRVFDGTKWIACDGRVVSAHDHRPLFQTIGHTYGQGDTSAEFRVPDMRGRALF